MAIVEPAGQIPEMSVEPVVHHHDPVPPDIGLHPPTMPLRDLFEWVPSVIEHVRPVRKLGPVAGIHVEQGEVFRLGDLADERIDRLVVLWASCRG